MKNHGHEYRLNGNCLDRLAKTKPPGRAHIWYAIRYHMGGFFEITLFRPI